jgi:hypothetical protein
MWALETRTFRLQFLLLWRRKQLFYLHGSSEQAMTDRQPEAAEAPTECHCSCNPFCGCVCHKDSGWQLAHDPAKCGHPRACWLDRNYPASESNYDPATHSSDPPMDYRCIMCEAEARLRATHELLREIAAKPKYWPGWIKRVRTFLQGEMP